MIKSRVERVRDQSTSQLLDGPGCACLYFPFPSFLKGANEITADYVLKGGEQYNTTIEGNVDEMREIYRDWDARCSS